MNRPALPCGNVFVLLFVLCTVSASALLAQNTAPDKKQVWKPVPFAIVKFNEEAPKSWNIYHPEKRGMILVRLWKRYLLVNLQEEEVYDIDPQKISMQGENVEWSMSAVPETPIDIAEWRQRDIGQLERIRFRFGKDGHFLELQLPLRPDGKTAY